MTRPRARRGRPEGRRHTSPAPARLASLASLTGLRGLTGLLGLLGALLVLPGVAAAQDEVPAPMDLAVTAVDGVVSLPTTAEPDPTVGITVTLSAGEDAREDLRAVVTVYTRVATPAALDAALRGETDAAFASVSTPLPAMQPGAVATTTITTSAAALDLDVEGREGVYPVDLRIFQGAEPVAGASTALVVQPDPARRPLPASMVVDVTADTLPMGSDDVAPPSLTALLRPDAPLVDQTRDLAAVAARGSAAGVVVVAEGRLLADLADVADGVTLPGGEVVDDASRLSRRAAGVLDRLRALVARADVELLALPYGPADLVALTRGGQGAQAAALVALGEGVVADVLGRDPSARIVVPPDGLDAEAVAALGPAQADAVLLDERYLALATTDRTEPVRRLRTADGGEVRILMPDGTLSALLRDPRDVGVPLVVQRLRAETALRWIAGDGDRDQGVLLHATIPGGVPDGMLPAVAAALAETPWLRPMGLSALASAVQPSDRVVRLAYPPSSRASELGADYVAALGEARDALVPLEALLPDDDTAVDRFALSLLGAASTAYRGADVQPEGLSRVQEVLDVLGAVAGGVSVVEGPPITLTSATGEIPVAVRNDTDLPLDVRVRLGSTRFEFAEPTQALVVPPRAVQTLTFTARALNPGGLAGVAVVVEDPTGQLELVATTIAVRSTALPVVALATTVAGALLLAMWGLRQTRRRRGAHEAGGRASERAA